MITSFRKAGLIGQSVVLLAGTALASAALSQTVADNDIPTTGLNIPANLQIFGKRDPNVRKPTALVNETVITGTDVDQRVALALAGNTVKLSEADREQLRLQVLSSLIDETLQIQEAKSREITVTGSEIDQSFGRIAKNFKKSVPEMRAYLRDIGSSERSLKRQIEAELAWNRYLRRRIEPLVNVGDEEVASIIKRLEAAKGTTEFHVREIYLAATPEREQVIFSEARSLMQDIQQGKRTFDQVALDRSDASTRAKAGDLGWVRATVLPETLAQAATQMQIGQIAGPIAVPGGFSLLALVDKRQVLTADIRDARLSLRQVSMTFPAGTTQASAAAKVAEFAAMTQSIHGCGGVAKAAATLGAEVVDSDSTRIRDLPQQLQQVIIGMQIGESTPPFGSPEDGVRALVLCGRDEPQGNLVPGMEQMRSQMEAQAVNLRAEHKLRDLRRDAIVEYR
ncbi:MAG: peptidylprolyl isomerase [Sphingomonas sp.]